MREWLVIENSMKNGIFVSAEVRDEKGYIPRDVAEAICGRSIADEIGEHFVQRSGYRFNAMRNISWFSTPIGPSWIKAWLGKCNLFEGLPFKKLRGSVVSIPHNSGKTLYGMDCGSTEARVIAWNRGASHQSKLPKNVYVTGHYTDPSQWYGTATGRINGQTGELKMSLSKDRVHFYPNQEKLSDHKYRRLLSLAFGLKDHEIPHYNPNIFEESFKIVCRPSQFARFLIWRNEEGFTNDFKSLEAKLVPAVNTPRQIDVSNRPAGR